MNIAITNIYGDYYCEDRLFNINSCPIGENLLLPGIMLKRRFEELGHEFHTADMYSFHDIDAIIFQDISPASLLTIDSPINFAKYVAKQKWKKDYLLKKVNSKTIKSLLIIQEPPILNHISYETKYHKYFDEILTWNDDLLTGKKYHKFQYPQTPPQKYFSSAFDSKHFAVMMASNKKNSQNNELYSKRYEIIRQFEERKLEFDLFGPGWNSEGFCCYKGLAEKKIETLSKYKFAFSYENMKGINGYITEKIFDCFFAGTVPIYWGADNITDYVPSDCFIDQREFFSFVDLYEFLKNMKESEYEKYRLSARDYLSSETFKKEFSIDSYIKRIEKLIL